MNHQLGESLTIGRYVYDGTGRFNVVLGPLSYDDYLSFLPGGKNRPLLRAVVAHLHARPAGRDARAAREDRRRAPLPARLAALRRR